MAHSTTLSRVVGRPVSVKPEHLQRTGSFKIRGAYNRIRVLAETGRRGRRRLGRQPRPRGRPGRHAHRAGVDDLHADRRLDPQGRGHPGLRGHGHAGRRDDRRLHPRGQGDAEKTGASTSRPSTTRWSSPARARSGSRSPMRRRTAGRGRVPVGGGGLIAGVAMALRRGGRRPIVGVEPVGAASMAAALEHGAPTRSTTATRSPTGWPPGPSRTHPRSRRNHVDEVVSVEDEEISKAILLLIERCKWVVEPAGAAASPPCSAGHRRFRGGHGGALRWERRSIAAHALFAYGVTAAGRYLRVKVVLRDQPGRWPTSLRPRRSPAEHPRSRAHPLGTSLRLGEVEALLTLETRDTGHRSEVWRSSSTMACGPSPSLSAGASNGPILAAQ